MAEFSILPALQGLVPLYAVLPDDDPSDRDRARLYVKEYIQLMSLLSPRTPESEKLQKLFLVFDADGDGQLSDKDLFQALRMLLGQTQTQEHINQLVRGILTKDDVCRTHLPIQEFVQYIPASEIAEKMTVDVPK
eukprot:m.88093 g.88093  ORF g.88093 m.88093 type:complete len:135 (+) comp36559_c0_seq6:230-634(+)